jgi:hypothetical protein
MRNTDRKLKTRERLTKRVTQVNREKATLSNNPAPHPVRKPPGEVKQEAEGADARKRSLPENCGNSR